MNSIQSSTRSNAEDMLAGDNMISPNTHGFNGEIEGVSEEEGYIGEFSRDYINAEIFKLFDVDGSGKITKNDLDAVSKQMGWNPRQSKYF